ncbi:DNA repair protein RecO [Thermodesulfatator indicus DSM 15286]|uniref:DNA repair protein RecO n=1 Tax=Thermodesulfatator indicus (strain DSM 15286 / JCM 11887 / CIR29812) TaxID=667014 RepID=F8ACW4_THEID|nr:DNA repair protein RecO [Thermodesulfatator indicus]AEH44756.1 DNA repair protein RecO [Thermodesulfatator indicus DSM 15286]
MNVVVQAIILSSQTLGEKDVRLELLSAERGRLAAVAKGGRKSLKRFVNTLEPFSLIQAHLRGGKVNLPPFLDQADLLNPFENLRFEPLTFAKAAYLSELVECFFKVGTGQAFFSFFEESLYVLNKGLDFWPLLKISFELSLLKASGFFPYLGESCLRCEKPLKRDVFFSFTEGGVVCENCAFEEDFALDLKLLAFLNHIAHVSPMRLRIIKPGAENLKRAERLIENFVLRVLNQEINSLRVLKEMFNNKSLANSHGGRP